MSTYKVCNCGFEIEIKESWKVLDIGSGHYPHTRADILLGKDIASNIERLGKSLKGDLEQKFIESDVQLMSFKNKVFDYVKRKK